MSSADLPFFFLNSSSDFDNAKIYTAHNRTLWSLLEWLILNMNPGIASVTFQSIKEISTIVARSYFVH